MADNSGNSPTPLEDSIPPNPSEEKVGKKSSIYDYCQDPQREGKTCIWFCRRQGRGFIAWDVDIESSATAFQSQNLNKWWRRFAFYNFIGVRHVHVSIEGCLGGAQTEKPDGINRSRF